MLGYTKEVAESQIEAHPGDYTPTRRVDVRVHLLPGLTIITTDLFPDLVPQIRSGAVAATIYQRPRAQGQMAFRMLHAFLTDSKSPSRRITLAPHLVMRGNLDFFLQRQSRESVKEKQQLPDKLPPAR